MSDTDALARAQLASIVDFVAASARYEILFTETKEELEEVKRKYLQRKNGILTQIKRVVNDAIKESRENEERSTS